MRCAHPFATLDDNDPTSEGKAEKLEPATTDTADQVETTPIQEINSREIPAVNKAQASITYPAGCSVCLKILSDELTASRHIIMVHSDKLESNLDFASLILPISPDEELIINE